MFRIATTITVLLSATTAYADDEAVIVAGKAAVTAKLIDPDSARFVDVHVITRNGRSITDDRFSNLAQPAAFSDICGS
jgi:hypothetical protein